MERAPENLLNKIKQIIKTDNYEEAERELNILRNSFPNDPWVLKRWADLHSKKGMLNESIDDLTEAINLAPTEPDFFYNRGIKYFIQGLYDAAIQDFTKVLDLCNYHVSNYYEEGAYFFRADAYCRLKKYDLAIKDCKKVRDDFETWTDRMRSKKEIMAECNK